MWMLCDSGNETKMFYTEEEALLFELLQKLEMT